MSSPPAIYPRKSKGSLSDGRKTAAAYRASRNRWVGQQAATLEVAQSAPISSVSAGLSGLPARLSHRLAHPGRQKNRLAS